MKLNRHQIREVAFQTLFAMDLDSKADPVQLFQTILKTTNANYPDYLLQLVNGVKSHRPALNAEISRFLKPDWTLDRIAKVDLIILQIAIYEIKNVKTVPNRVAVNEALQLANEYSDPRSRRFVNGILDHELN